MSDEALERIEDEAFAAGVALMRGEQTALDIRIEELERRIGRLEAELKQHRHLVPIPPEASCDEHPTTSPS